MMPRLEAARELASINAMNAAFGGMKAHERARYIGRLEGLANGRTQTAPATPEALATMGVAVIIVPPRSETNNG